jgi:hypothetical protein
MPGQWYYKIGEKEAGPVTFQQLVEMVRSGTLVEDHGVRRELSQEWTAARDVIGLYRAAGIAKAEIGSPEPAKPPAQAMPASSGPGPAPRTSPPAAAGKPGPRRFGKIAWIGCAVAASLVALAAAYRAWSGRAILPPWVPVLGARPVVREDFHGRTLNRSLWKPAHVSGRMGPKDGRLHVLVPRGSAGRVPEEIQSLAKIEGDFDIRADYGLVSLPKVKAGEIKVEIGVVGPEGAAVVFRSIHHKEGETYGLWFHAQEQGDAPPVFLLSRTTDRAGTMRLQRSGEELIGYAAGPGEDFRELGRASFGDGPVHTLLFRGAAPATDSDTEVTFANVEIQADRIIVPGLPARAWPWLVGLAVPAAALGVFLYRRFAGRMSP